MDNVCGYYFVLLWLKELTERCSGVKLLINFGIIEVLPNTLAAALNFSHGSNPQIFEPSLFYIWSDF